MGENWKITKPTYKIQIGLAFLLCQRTWNVSFHFQDFTLMFVRSEMGCLFITKQTRTNYFQVRLDFDQFELGPPLRAADDKVVMNDSTLALNHDF